MDCRYRLKPSQKKIIEYSKADHLRISRYVHKHTTVSPANNRTRVKYIGTALRGTKMNLLKLKIVTQILYCI